MKTLGTLSLLLALLLIASPPATAEITLKVYGPGGPLAPMKECAERFQERTGIRVEVTGGPADEWVERALQDADVLYGGAEYMLTALAQKHPGLIDARSRTELYVRPAGILVRKGNPRRIRGLADLTRPGLRLVDVNGAGQVGLWEDLAGRLGLVPGIQRNIAVTVETSAEAIRLWKGRPELDAWISFESWHFRLRDDTDLVRLPRDQVLYRGTPVALAAATRHRAQAAEFVAFLKSQDGHRVFRKWGWK